MYFLVTHMNKPGDEESTDTEESIQLLALDIAAVTSLEWKGVGVAGSLSLGEGGTWTATEDSSIIIDQTYPEAMLSALSEIVATRAIENADLSEYGLSEPAYTIQIPEGAISGGAISGSNPTALLIGDESGLGGQRYLSAGDDTVYLVDTALYDAFAYNITDIQQQEESGTGSAVGTDADEDAAFDEYIEGLVSDE
jgi:hypothetical protein